MPSLKFRRTLSMREYKNFTKKYAIDRVLGLRLYAKKKRAGALGSDHPELHPARFADHILIPGRVPNELDIGFIDAVDGQNLALRIVGDGWSHPAARRRERHFHFHARAAVILFSQTAIVNQTKIDNINRNFRVVALRT